MNVAQLTGRAIKIVVVLDAAQAAEVLAPFAEVAERIPVQLAVEGRTLRFEVAPKAVRKCLAAISAHGPEGVVVLVQGKLLSGDVVGDAGLVAQARAPKPEQAAAE